MNESIGWAIQLLFMPIIAGAAIMTAFGVMLWLRMARDIPYWWTFAGILAGIAVGHFAVTPDWELLVLSRQVIGAAIGGLIADGFWLVLRKTGHAG